MSLSPITYKTLVDIVKDYILTNCHNFSKYDSMESCFKPGYHFTIVVPHHGGKTYTPYSATYISQSISRYSDSTLTEDLNNFLTSIKVIDKLNENIKDSDFINFVCNMVSFCSTKCCFTTSQYSNNKLLVYQPNSSYSEINPITQASLIRQVYVNDAILLMKTAINVSSQNFRCVPCTYNYSLW